ncbi:GIP [Symbiodinium sp. CCMP2456]|nr:GIP [Symbiodinium sp. CCMP2456]
MIPTPSLAPPPHEDVPNLLEFIQDRRAGTDAGDLPANANNGLFRPRGPPGLGLEDGLRGQQAATSAWFPQVPSFPEFPQRDARADSYQELWTCRVCQSSDCRWDRMRDSWFCGQCGSSQLYDASQPTTEETSQGVWTYIPHASPSSSGSSPRSSASSASTWARPRAQRGVRHRPGPEPPDRQLGETAESEAPTLDPTVTPSENGLSDQGGRQQRPNRRQRRAERLGKGDRPTARSEPEPDSTTIRDLRKLLKGKNGSDPGSWASGLGPEKGVRWRGGTPPAPPKWHYSKDDLRAFSKFERRVGIWQLQIKPYMSEAEAALTLYCSLSGEPEEELEHIDINKIYAKDGISFLMEQLRGPLQAKQIYLKRKYLSDYETIGRFPGESLRNYVNRYHRAEKALLSIGIDVGLTYDAESRGSRLLDRAKLSTEQQRMVLVGTSQSLSFDDVKNALVLQYPDHKPPPFLQGQGYRDQGQSGGSRPPKGNGKGKFYGKGGGQGSSSSPTTATSSGNGNPYRKAYVADVNDQHNEDDQGQQLDAIPEDDNGEAEEAYDEEELIPDNGDEEAIDDETVESLMEVLTVTSRKLQAMTQGRKYRGAPRKSIEERKKTSACSACGQVGHWAGDPECSASAKGKASGKGKHPASTDGGDKRAAAQKVFSVRHAGGHEVLYDFSEFEAGDPSQGLRDPAGQVHRTLVVFQSAECTCLTNLSELQGYCVVDTACQRSCSSRQWCDSHVELLKSFGLSAKCARRLEAFQFGAGPPQRSDSCMYFPVGFDVSQPMLAMSASILDNISIPFLASLAVLKKMRVVLDLARQKAYIGLLDCTVDLHLLQGHLCLKISEFPASAPQFDWSELDYHDCEFLCSTQIMQQVGVMQESSSRDQVLMSFVSDAGNSSSMVEQLEKDDPGRQADIGPCCGTVTSGMQAGGKGHGREHNPGRKGEPLKAEKEATDAGAPSELRTSVNEEARQRPGAVRNMQHMPRPLEVGRRWTNPWVALSSVFQVLCAALAVGPECGGRLVDPSNSILFNGATGISGEDATSSDFSNFGVRVPWDTGDGNRDVPLDRGRGGRGLRLERAVSSQQQAGIKKGTQKRMINNIEKTIQLLNREINVYEDHAQEPNNKFEADFMELFWHHKFKKPGLECSLAQRANHYGLSFVDFGNLDMGKQPRDIYEALLRAKPQVIFVHNMQRLWRYGNILSETILKCCEHQVNSGASFIIDFDMNTHEDPYGIMATISNMPETKEVIFKDDPQGMAHTFVTNSKCLARASKKAPGTHDVADAVLASIQGEARMKCPWRFDVEPHNVWYAPPLDEPEAWMSFIESLEKRLGRSRYFYLSEGSKEMKQLKQLVPWEITRAQVCAQPMTRRLPSDIPFTHRGAALILNTGKLHVESEDMGEVRQPKLKFDTPVRIAVLFYGMAEDDKPTEKDGNIPDVHVPGLRTDISFPGIPETITKEVKAAVARLHCNAGHPPKQELIRLLAAHGSINAAVLTALEHLKCGTCERARAPLKPRPAAVPEFVGQFAEQLQEQLDTCLSAAIWAVNTSIHTRGRKTATSRAKINELLPGSMVAYWRWNLKARGRKRGGYILGRLVVKDDKNAWVQSGGSLVQVTHEQLRPAVGIETWVPSAEDVRLLKEGGKLLQAGLWDDGRVKQELNKTTVKPTSYQLLDVTFHSVQNHSHLERNKQSVYLRGPRLHNLLYHNQTPLLRTFKSFRLVTINKIFGRWVTTPGREGRGRDRQDEPHQHPGHHNYNLLHLDNLQRQRYLQHQGGVHRQGWTKSVTEFLLRRT